MRAFPIFIFLGVVLGASVLAAQTVVKRETFLLLPEPWALRVGHSTVQAGSRATTFTPAREVSNEKIETYTSAEFAKLGIGKESFAERAKVAADRRLATLSPELIKGKDGKILYAVYRGESPTYASLLVAPSLAKVFENVFGGEIWLAAPDRHALYVFPANQAAVAEFAADLEERFQTEAYAASSEIFSLSAKDGSLKVIGSFTEH